MEAEWLTTYDLQKQKSSHACELTIFVNLNTPRSKRIRRTAALLSICSCVIRGSLCKSLVSRNYHLPDVRKMILHTLTNVINKEKSIQFLFPFSVWRKITIFVAQFRSYCGVAKKSPLSDLNGDFCGSKGKILVPTSWWGRQSIRWRRHRWWLCQAGPGCHVRKETPRASTYW